MSRRRAGSGRYRAAGPGPVRLWTCWLGLLPAAMTAAAELPTVASINLCTDQLVLSVAAPGQILSLSWLSADPEESMLAPDAARYPHNYGSAEELIEIGADVVIAGSQTSPFTRQLLGRLGTRVVEIEPESSIDDIRRNLALVGAAIGREGAAAEREREMQARLAAIERKRGNAALRSAVVVRPGGFTIGRGTLAFELLELAGLTNSIAALDRWGSLSIETLLTAQPDYLVLTEYRSREASLANTVFRHPALVGLEARVRVVEVPSRYFACGAPESLAAVEILLAQMDEP